MMPTKEHSPFIMLDDKNSTAPLYRQIYKAIQRAILSGECLPGTRLPASRVLSQQLGVSRITVVNAYEQLFAEGYLEGKIGAGTYVAAQLPEDLLNIEKRKIAAASKFENPLPLRLSPFGERLQNKDVKSVRAQTIATFQPFQNGLTAVDKFPFEIWSRIAARINRNPPNEILGYGEPQGYLPLREAVAAHLKAARGVNCTSAQIIITSGAQQGLDLTARIFLSETDAMWVEDPCYREARSAFAATGAKIVSVPVDDEGFNLAAAPKGSARAKLIYVTPSHQYPLGVTMSLSRRLALIEWAKKNNAWIIEDDYNSEFRYAGRPLASLQGLDRNGRVIYVGTFSKTIFPSLRIGCLVVPPELIDIYTVARALNDVHSSLIEQAILTEFIREGHFARHVRRMRTLYEERQRILVEECEKQLGDMLEVKRADAGMHVVGWLPEGVSGANISRRAAEHKLKLAPISAYCVNESPRDDFVLGYTAFDKKQIRNAVKKLKTLLVDELQNK